MRYALPQPQSTTVKRDAGRSTVSPTTFRNSLTWSYLPRIEARILPLPSAMPVTRRNAAESNDTSGNFFTRSCGCTTTTRSISAERVTRTWPLRVTRTCKSPFDVIRCKSRAPGCAMTSSSPLAAASRSRFFTWTCPSSVISAWNFCEPPISTGRMAILNVLPLRRTVWTSFMKPSPITRARISSFNFGSSSKRSKPSPLSYPCRRIWRVCGGSITSGTSTSVFFAV